MRRIWVMPLADYSAVEPGMFWRLMEFHHWAHPYDEKGRRHEFESIPKHLSQLKDDPYRSLAGEVRKAGGYAKDVAPFTEFLWADFFRKHFGKGALRAAEGQGLPQAMVVSAVAQARGASARFLPGWSGVDGPAASKA